MERDGTIHFMGVRGKSRYVQVICRGGRNPWQDDIRGSASGSRPRTEGYHDSEPRLQPKSTYLSGLAWKRPDTPISACIRCLCCTGSTMRQAESSEIDTYNSFVV